MDDGTRIRRRYERQSSGRLVGAIASNQLSEDEAALAREVVWDREKRLGRLSARSILAIALVGIVAGTAAAWAMTRGLLP